MKVSLNWLKDYVKFDLSDRDYAELMTGTGTKVETIERLGEDIENVVAGRINSVTPHPDSDHLVICIVDVGGEKPLQIVTGAQNVNAGDLVPDDVIIGLVTERPRLPQRRQAARRQGHQDRQAARGGLGGYALLAVRAGADGPRLPLRD